MSERRERKPSAAQQGRHAARELAVQGLYQWQMTGKSITTIEAEFRSQVADDDLEDHENWVKVMESVSGSKKASSRNVPSFWKIWTRWGWRFFVSALTSFPGEWKCLTA